MLSRFIQHFQEKGCKTLIATSNAVHCINNFPAEIPSGMSFQQVTDARSAAFFAYGKAKISMSAVLLILNADEMPHSYTALTEAWFQKVPLIVVSLSSDENPDGLEYLEPCIRESWTLSSDSTDSDLCRIADRSSCGTGPVLIRLSLADCHPPEEPCSRACEDVISKLAKFLRSGEHILYFGDTAHAGIKENYLIRIGANTPYGVISKYMGFILGCKARSYLVAPLSVFGFDANIFNNRYIDQRFRVVFVKNGEEKFVQPAEWIKSNGIHYTTCDRFTPEAANDFVMAEQASVVIVNAD